MTQPQADYFAERVAVLTRILGAPDPGEQETAIMEALEFADQAARVAWEGTAGRATAERLRAALRAAAAEPESLPLALPVGDQGGNTNGKQE
jgi:hypothetical protein